MPLNRLMTTTVTWWGSQVLKEMGALLKSSVRDVDVVIRYGGDEYTIILVETNCLTAGIVAERIRKLVESHVFMVAAGHNIRMTCSIGYSCCPEDTMSKQDLLEMADRAMYAGKADGRNCVQTFQCYRLTIVFPEKCHVPNTAAHGIIPSRSFFYPTSTRNKHVHNCNQRF